MANLKHFQTILFIHCSSKISFEGKHFMRLSAVVGGTKIQTNIELNSKAALQSSRFFFPDKNYLDKFLIWALLTITDLNTKDWTIVLKKLFYAHSQDKYFDAFSDFDVFIYIFY